MQRSERAEYEMRKRDLESMMLLGCYQTRRSMLQCFSALESKHVVNSTVGARLTSARDRLSCSDPTGAQVQEDRGTCHANLSRFCKDSVALSGKRVSPFTTENTHIVRGCSEGGSRLLLELASVFSLSKRGTLKKRHPHIAHWHD